MIDFLRIGARLLDMVAWTLLCIPVQMLLLLLPGRGAERFARLYWRGMRRIMGMRITVIGAVAHNRPVLFVANHTSWLISSPLAACCPPVSSPKAKSTAGR